VSVGSSDCDYGFEPGRQYLIYARRTPDGRWTTSRCAGTKPLEEAAADLDYIGGLATAEPLGRVYGKIERTVIDPIGTTKASRVPATGVTIALTGKSNLLTVTTDEDGKIDARVPPDEYTIKPGGFFQLRLLSGVTYIFKASVRPGEPPSPETATVVFVDQQTERIRVSIRSKSPQ
jgi:hypothetical protein